MKFPSLRTFCVVGLLAVTAFACKHAEYSGNASSSHAASQIEYPADAFYGVSPETEAFEKAQVASLYVPAPSTDGRGIAAVTEAEAKKPDMWIAMLMKAIREKKVNPQDAKEASEVYEETFSDIQEITSNHSFSDREKGKRILVKIPSLFNHLANQPKLPAFLRRQIDNRIRFTEHDAFYASRLGLKVANATPKTASEINAHDRIDHIAERTSEAETWRKAVNFALSVAGFAT